MKEFDLDKSINHTIIFASTLLKRQLFALFKKNDLEVTPEQWVVLYYLWNQDGLSIGEIAQKTNKDTANITRIINRMLSQGLIQKLSSENDKRFNYVYLTAEANNIKASVYDSIFKSTDIFSKGLSVEEKETLLFLLNKVILNMSDFAKSK